MASLSPEKRKLLEVMLRQKGVGVSSQSTIPRRSEGAHLPLAFNQEGLWFIDRLDPGKANYNIPGTVRLLGRLNLQALSQSLSEILRRHEALRTVFVSDESGRPCQRIMPPSAVELQPTDLRDLPAVEREAHARRLATEEARRPFDLEHGPLVRFHVLKLGAQDHVLMLNLHHIIADGWSMGVLTRELSSLYAAFVAGRSSPLPELPIQFGDYVLWQRQQLQGGKVAAELAYWKERLGGTLPELDLPLDRTRPKIASYNGRHQPVQVDGNVSESLRTLARNEGVTLYSLLLAAFKATLCYYTRERDIIIGSSFANRNRSELEDLIGYFVNTLPLRTDLSGNPEFRELIARVQQVSLDTSSHQELPLATLVQELQLERDLSRNPIYQVVFDFLTPDRNPAVYGYGMSSTVVEKIELPDLTIVPMDVEGEVARFDIAIFIWDMPDGLSGVFEYNTDLFEDATIEGLIKRFLSVLNQIIDNPSIRLEDLVDRLVAAEHHELLRRAKEYRTTTHKKLKRIKRRVLSIKVAR